MMVGEAVKYIEANRDSPFLMYVAFNLPNYPEQTIGKFASAYADMPMPRQSYTRVISLVDDHIGRILNKLDEAGIADNTIVIMMGDNGHSTENLKGVRVNNHASGYPKGHYYSAHGGGGNTGKRIDHKGNFLEGGIRVQAIIRYPKTLPKKVVRDQMVTVMDWFPTVLELAEIPKPDVTLDGRSMFPVICDAKAPSAHKVLHFDWPNSWAVREGNWKLIGIRNQKRNYHPLRITQSRRSRTGSEELPQGKARTGGSSAGPAQQMGQRCETQAQRRRQMMSGIGKLVLAVLCMVSAFADDTTADEPLYDIVVYGDSSGAVTAAVAAKRQGRSVILVNPTRFLGSMSASGLGATDFLGKRSTFGGIASEFYDATAAAYGKTYVRSFEPHVGQQVFDKLVADACVPVVFN